MPLSLTPWVQGKRPVRIDARAGWQSMPASALRVRVLYVEILHELDFTGNSRDRKDVLYVSRYMIFDQSYGNFQ